MVLQRHARRYLGSGLVSHEVLCGTRILEKILDFTRRRRCWRQDARRQH